MLRDRVCSRNFPRSFQFTPGTQFCTLLTPPLTPQRLAQYLAPQQSPTRHPHTREIPNMADTELDTLYGPLEAMLDEHDRALDRARRKKKQTGNKRSVLATGVHGERWLKNHEDNQRQPCQFFPVGRCKFGQNCAYSHDAELLRHTNQVATAHNVIERAPDTSEREHTALATSFRKGPKLCRFFLLGTCRAGANCTYVHGPVSQSSSGDVPPAQTGTSEATVSSARQPSPTLGKRKRLPDADLMGRNVRADRPAR